MHIVSIVGARPNFPKLAPIARELSQREDIRHTIIHTGQHYDHALSDSFLDVLEIPQPDFNLAIGSGGHGWQTGRIMQELEPRLLDLRPDCLITVGDVNSTAAASLVAVKLGIKVAHVEAGLRSFDRNMPEEINRLVTDAISDFLFVSEQSGMDNLKNEGVPDAKVHFVGNVMIDTLIHLLPKIRQRNVLDHLGLNKGNYIVVTLHRPDNVDHRGRAQPIVDALVATSRQVPVVFPIHPRSRKSFDELGLLQELEQAPGVEILEPFEYLEFMSLVSEAKAIITDSGGIQEETTYLGIPCLTLRPNTERPSTITLGTNELVAPQKKQVTEALTRILNNEWKQGSIPPLWDGKAAHRIVEVLVK